jgi:hypothetical protein
MNTNEKNEVIILRGIMLFGDVLCGVILSIYTLSCLLLVRKYEYCSVRPQTCSTPDDFYYYTYIPFTLFSWCFYFAFQCFMFQQLCTFEQNVNTKTSDEEKNLDDIDSEIIFVEEQKKIFNRKFVCFIIVIFLEVLFSDLIAFLFFVSYMKLGCGSVEEYDDCEPTSTYYLVAFLLMIIWFFFFIAQFFIVKLFE